MASQSRVYTDSDIRLIKWRFIMTRVASRPIRLILQNETVGKGNDESYIDYFKRNHKKLQNLFRTDKDLMKESNTKPEDLDIPLLYKVIRHGNCRLADGGDEDKWKEGNSNIESLITRVKDLRQELFHEESQISEKEFQDRTEMLRKLLTDLMSCIEQIYSIDVTQELDQVNKDIDKYRDNDIEDEDIVKYRFDKNCERLEKEGKESIKDQYKKMNETVVNTVNHIVDLSSPVDDIFSDMELEKSEDQRVKITYHHIFEGLCYTSDDPLILLEGDPGVGKTTLVKKVISEWMNDTKSVVGLDRYSLVLHHEFRNAITKDFNALLKDRMPDIAISMKDEELRKAALHVNSLTILDGLDEVNDASVLLFDEVLDLKKNYGITVMITSRPEKLGYLKSRLNALNMTFKHICLLGVPIDQREAFVEKYHKKMTEEDTTKQGINTPDIEHLKKYLEETKYRLKNLWRLPYNLTLITILYVAKLIDLNKITTAPELYQEIFRLYRTKLKERLRNFSETKMLQDSELEKILDIFIHYLAKESFIGLMKNQINLPEEAYKRLEGVCKCLKVPAEQMIGAFLRVVPNTSSLISYGYPHKGIQDYLSARYIWMLLTSDYQSMEIQRIISNVFSVLSSQRSTREVEEELKENEMCHIEGISQKFDAESTIKGIQAYLVMNSVPKNIIDETTEFLHKRLEAISGGEQQTETGCDHDDTAAKSKQSLCQESTIVRDILLYIHKECFSGIHGKSSHVSQSEGHKQISSVFIGRKSERTIKFMSDIEKFHNMLVCLLGLLSSEKNEIKAEVKLEILKLLKETGVKDHNSWLNLLGSVKCDTFAAAFIAGEIGIFNTDMRVDDSTLFPYLSLMKSLENLPEHADKIKVTLDIREAYDTKVIVALLHQLNRLNMELTKMEFHYDFRNPSACQDPQLQTEIGLIMKRCPVEIYIGSKTDISFSHSLERLFMSVTTKEEIKALNSFIKQSQTLTYADLCVSADFDHRNFIPIHHPRSYPPSLHIVNIEMKNVMNSANIIKSLQPLNGSQNFWRIFFPGCNLNLLDLIESLGLMGIRSYSLCFPSSLKPQQQQQQQLVKEEANRKLGCWDVYWGGTDRWGNSIDEW